MARATPKKFCDEELGKVTAALRQQLRKNRKFRGISSERVDLLCYLFRQSATHLADGELIIHPGDDKLQNVSRLQRTALKGARKWLTGELQIWRIEGGGLGRGEALELRLDVHKFLDFLQTLKKPPTKSLMTRIHTVLFFAKEAGGYGEGGVLKKRVGLKSEKRVGFDPEKGSVTDPRYTGKNHQQSSLAASEHFDKSGGNPNHPSCIGLEKEGEVIDLVDSPSQLCAATSSRRPNFWETEDTGPPPAPPFAEHVGIETTSPDDTTDEPWRTDPAPTGTPDNDRGNR